jgi:hypothetical protein
LTGEPAGLNAIQLVNVWHAVTLFLFSFQVYKDGKEYNQPEVKISSSAYGQIIFN